MQAEALDQISSLPILGPQMSPSLGERAPHEKSLLFSTWECTATVTHPELRWALPQPPLTSSTPFKELYLRICSRIHYYYESPIRGNKSLVGEGLGLKKGMR